MEKEEYNNQRRLRASKQMRELASDVVLSHRDFIQPLFVDESVAQRTPIASLNEIYAETILSAIEQIDDDLKKGIDKFLLFPVPTHKSTHHFDFRFILSATRQLKEKFGDRVWLAADVCLCAYTSHGHCGILNEEQSRVLHFDTVNVLADYSLKLAQAGVDCIAPSDMMDGRVSGIRKILDANGFDHIAIMSYSSKFASQFYGPFRDACHSKPNNNAILKDRKTYQISSFNKSDAVSSALRDRAEGADIIMVKPSLPYLDIICLLKSKMNNPIAAYHVSGEYQSLELLAAHRLIERSKAHVEIWTSLKRAGANIIISYAARYSKKWIEEIEY